jgi:tripartite-type tricarboxylate transporter receptor subunit TctC
MPLTASSVLRSRGPAAVCAQRTAGPGWSAADPGASNDTQYNPGFRQSAADRSRIVRIGANRRARSTRTRGGGMHGTRIDRDVALALLACAYCAAPNAAAQAYPSKPVRIVVGFPAGSGADLIARTLGQRLSAALGQPAVVENRTGAGGTIATAYVAGAGPDGHTLLQVTAAETAQPALREKMTYDLRKDFAPISLAATGTFVLVVHPSVPARDVKQLIAIARAQPGKLNYGTSGPGSSPHLAAALLQQLAQVSLLEVPYKGATEAVTATVAGEIDLSFPSITAALPLMHSGRVRVLAVTSANRAALLPQVPTVSESGLPGFQRSTWHGLLAPAGVSKETIGTLNAVVVKAVNAADVRELFTRQGLEARSTTPEQFAQLIRDEIAQVTQLIASTRARAQ